MFARIQPRGFVLWLWLALLAGAGSRMPLALNPARDLSQFQIQHWETKDGLPQPGINKIAQDAAGYIWLATGAGAARFDGQRFAVYNRVNTRALHSDNILAVAVTDDGTVWLAISEGGLVRWRPGGDGFERLPELAALDHESVLCLAPGEGGSLHFGTQSHGLGRWSAGGVSFWKPKSDDELSQITSVLADPVRGVWFGTDRGRLYKLTAGEPVPQDLALPRGGRLASMTFDHDGKLWIAVTGAGLIGGEPGRLEVVRHPLIPPEQSVQSVLTDRQGAVWVAVDGHGIVRIAPDGSEHALTEREGLGYDSATSFFEDRDGQMWVGLVYGGLNRLEEGVVWPFGARQNLPGSRCGGTVIDRGTGRLWFGAPPRGLWTLDPFSQGVQRDARPVPALSLGDRSIQAIHQDTRGGWWLGSLSSLQRWNGRELEDILTQAAVRDVEIWCVHEDWSGALWVGTGGEGLWLSRNPGDAKPEFLRSEGPLPKKIRSFCPDPAGPGLWIGTQADGIWRYDPKPSSTRWPPAPDEFRRVPLGLDIADQSIRTMIVDRDGVLWAATRGAGLLRLADGRAFQFDARCGFNHETVFHLAADEHGNLWFTSTTGLGVVARADLNRVAAGEQAALTTVRTFTEADGMPSAECAYHQPAGVTDAQGRIWFATKRGMAMVDPREFEQRTRAQARLSVQIESLRVDGSPVRWRDRPAVPPGRGTVEIEFTAPFFNAAAPLRFKTRLRRGDVNLEESGPRRSVAYANLPPGDYEFDVTVTDPSGRETSLAQPVVFALLPHLYQTLGFRLAVTLGGIALVLGLVRWRGRQLRLRAAALERRVAERTKELAGANRQLEAEIVERKRAEEALRDLPHQILLAQETERRRVSGELHDSVNQMLASVKFRLQHLETLIPAPAKAAREAAALSRGLIERALNEVRRISRNLRPSELDDLGLEPALEQMLEELQERTGVRVQLHFPPLSERWSANLEAALYRIIQEALTNIERHAGATEVSVSLTLEGEILRLTVQDNGRGFPAPAGERGRRRQGGLGLTNMRERANAIGGVLTLHSVPGQGARISLHLKLQTKPAHVP